MFVESLDDTYSSKLDGKRESSKPLWTWCPKPRARVFVILPAGRERASALLDDAPVVMEASGVDESAAAASPKGGGGAVATKKEAPATASLKSHSRWAADAGAVAESSAKVLPERAVADSAAGATALAAGQEMVASWGALTKLLATLSEFDVVLVDPTAPVRSSGHDDGAADKSCYEASELRYVGVDGFFVSFCCMTTYLTIIMRYYNEYIFKL